MAQRDVAYPQVLSTSPESHAVQFYEDDSDLVEALADHIGQALLAGHSAIVVATKKHRESLREKLRRRGINLESCKRKEQFIELDARETLAKFMVGGGPDQQQFDSVIGGLISRAQTQKESGKNLVVFGEMVALLWEEEKRDATVRLEELWNGLAERHPFHLLCGYPVRAFERLEHRQLFFNICGEHSHVGRMDRPSRQLHPEHGNNVVELQPQGRALENEIRLSQQRILLLQKVAKAGVWEMDVANDLFSFSSAAAKVLGFSSASRVRLSQLLDLMYYSGDREQVFTNLQQSQRHRKEFKASFRVRSGDDTRLVEMRGKTFYNADNPIMLGVVIDATPNTSNNPSQQ